MMNAIDAREAPELEIALVEPEPVKNVIRSEKFIDAAQKAELRRQMYERIAQGHALAEAEDQARRKQQGR